MGVSKYKIGDKFNSITILSLIDGTRPKKIMARCDCGNEYIAFLSNIVRSKSKKCRKCGSIRYFYDLTGKTFGKLMALKREGNKWVCRCDCGNLCNRRCSDLNFNISKGHVSSCGLCPKIKSNIDSFRSKASVKSTKSIVGCFIKDLKILSCEYIDVSKSNKKRKLRCYYKCRCICKKTVLIRSDSINAYTSCIGCSMKRRAEKAKIKEEESVIIKNLIQDCKYSIIEISDIYKVSLRYIKYYLRKYKISYHK